MTEERLKALSDAIDDLIKRIIKLEEQVKNLEYRIYSLECQAGRLEKGRAR